MICASTQSHAQMMLRKRLAGELRGADAMIPLNTAVRVRAQQLARAKVQDAVKRQGAKWSALSAAQKQSWAVLFLEDHPSLIEQARQEVEAWARAGFFGKKVQRELCAQFNNSAQTQEPCSNKEISVQQLGAE
jgi:hypothetical protein